MDHISLETAVNLYNLVSEIIISLAEATWTEDSEHLESHLNTLLENEQNLVGLLKKNESEAVSNYINFHKRYPDELKEYFKFLMQINETVDFECKALYEELELVKGGYTSAKPNLEVTEHAFRFSDIVRWNFNLIARYYEKLTSLNNNQESRNFGNETKTAQELNYSRLNWKGTPAQFAFIINLLEQKGYIEALSPYGERKAKLLLAHFNIDGFKPSKDSLGQCFQQLKNDELPINKDDAAKFQRIPHRNDLKK